MEGRVGGGGVNFIGARTEDPRIVSTSLPQRRRYPSPPIFYSRDSTSSSEVPLCQSDWITVIDIWRTPSRPPWGFSFPVGFVSGGHADRTILLRSSPYPVAKPPRLDPFRSSWIHIGPCRLASSIADAPWPTISITDALYPHRYYETVSTGRLCPEERSMASLLIEALSVFIMCFVFYHWHRPRSATII